MITESLSPARARLAELHAARDAATAAAKEASARVARLDKISHEADGARAKLARLDAEEAARFGAWARDDMSKPMPSVSTAERVDAQRELVEASARGDAAGRAADALRSDVSEATRRAAEIEKDIRAAVADVLIEETSALIPAIGAAVRGALDAKAKFDAGRSLILAAASAALPDTRLHRALETLDKAAAEAALLPASGAMPEHASEWAEFAAALARDAHATLDGEPGADAEPFDPAAGFERARAVRLAQIGVAA